MKTFKNNPSNPFAYYNFRKGFLNAIAAMPNITNAQKLIYLKGYVTSEAHIRNENLPLEDNNYELAIKRLDSNFLYGFDS